MEHWGGGNVPVSYKTIATSAANQTYAAQLTELKATYDTLTDDEKMRCVLIRGNIFYHNNVITGEFSRTLAGSSNSYIQSMNISNQTYYIHKLPANTTSDETLSSNQYTLNLMLLSNY